MTTREENLVKVAKAETHESSDERLERLTIRLREAESLLERINAGEKPFKDVMLYVEKYNLNVGP